jgi:hypothetical protein
MVHLFVHSLRNTNIIGLHSFHSITLFTCRVYWNCTLDLPVPETGCSLPWRSDPEIVELLLILPHNHEALNRSKRLFCRRYNFRYFAVPTAPLTYAQNIFSLGLPLYIGNQGIKRNSRPPFYLQSLIILVLYKAFPYDTRSN